jgi:EmrB/QacA subfamily drug resistance transporter
MNTAGVTASRPHYGLTFAVLAISGFAVSTLQSLILPAIPALEQSLHTSETGASWLLTATLLTAAIATPILGRVGDIFGKKKTLIVVLVLLSAGTLLSAVATSLPLMLLGRVIQGTGGSIFPLSFGIIRDEFPPQRVATGIGTISSTLGIGAGAGIVLAGPIIEHFSYHWLFWFPLIMTVGATVATVILVPESPVRAGGTINVPGALFLSGWLLTGLLALSEGPTWGWTNPKTLSLFVATVPLFLLWIWAEVRSSCPLVDMKMMRIPAVWCTNFAALLFGFGLFAMFILVPDFVETPAQQGYGFGASVTQSGLFLAPFAVTMLLVAPLTGRLSAPFGSKPLLVAGALFGAASYVLLVLAHNDQWSFYLSSGLLGIGLALGFASLANLIIEAVPSHQTGVATGINTNFRSIGGAIGSAITTSIVVSTLLPSGFPEEHGYVIAFVVCAATFVMAGLTALRIPSRAPYSAVVVSAHAALEGETEVFGGSASWVPEA